MLESLSFFIQWTIIFCCSLQLLIRNMFKIDNKKIPGCFMKEEAYVVYFKLNIWKKKKKELLHYNKRYSLPHHACICEYEYEVVKFDFKLEWPLAVGHYITSITLIWIECCSHLLLLSSLLSRHNTNYTKKIIKWIFIINE